MEFKIKLKGCESDSEDMSITATGLKALVDFLYRRNDNIIDEIVSVSLVEIGDITEHFRRVLSETEEILPEEIKENEKSFPLDAMVYTRKILKRLRLTHEALVELDKDLGNLLRNVVPDDFAKGEYETHRINAGGLIDLNYATFPQTDPHVF